MKKCWTCVWQQLCGDLLHVAVHRYSSSVLLHPGVAEQRPLPFYTTNGTGSWPPRILSKARSRLLAWEACVGAGHCILSTPLRFLAASPRAPWPSSLGSFGLCHGFDLRVLVHCAETPTTGS